MYPDSDPRSWNYVRTYDRPSLNIPGVILSCCLCVLADAFLLVLLHCLLKFSVKISVLVSMLALLAIVLARLNKIIIWCVKCYQRFAPIHVRSMCRFEPSCSEYMIQAVEKYGAVKGIRKGIDRIVRCAHKDGGFDYP